MYIPNVCNEEVYVCMEKCMYKVPEAEDPTEQSRRDQTNTHKKQKRKNCVSRSGGEGGVVSQVPKKEKGRR